MQLQEPGKLDLDTDIKAYLDFQIRPAFCNAYYSPQFNDPTGGFEEETREIILINPKGAPTREFLIANQPRRLFPAGVIPGYSNYGVGLGSYIVGTSKQRAFRTICCGAHLCSTRDEPLHVFSTSAAGLGRFSVRRVAFSCLFLTWFAIHWNILGPATRF